LLANRIGELIRSSINARPMQFPTVRQFTPEVAIDLPPLLAPLGDLLHAIFIAASIHIFDSSVLDVLTLPVTAETLILYDLIDRGRDHRVTDDRVRDVDARLVHDVVNEIDLLVQRRAWPIVRIRIVKLMPSLHVA